MTDMACICRRPAIHYKPLNNWLNMAAHDNNTVRICMITYGIDKE